MAKLDVGINNEKIRASEMEISQNKVEHLNQHTFAEWYTIQVLLNV